MSAVLNPLANPAPPSTELSTRRALIAVLLMILFAAMAWLLTPTHKLVDMRGKPDLEALVPHQFGDWREEKMTFASIINPQQEEQLQRIYSQILTRTYVNGQGRRIMLSLAYGEDQRDGMQLHYPEVCYPAQGFMLLQQQPGTMELLGRSVKVKRLSTQMGAMRRESVTYWTLLGDSIVQGGTAKKVAELRYGLKGFISDGLLFRVSSIEQDPREGYLLQETFSQDLMQALTPEGRRRVLGLN